MLYYKKVVDSGNPIMSNEYSYERSSLYNNRIHARIDYESIYTDEGIHGYLYKYDYKGNIIKILNDVLFTLKEYKYACLSFFSSQLNSVGPKLKLIY